VSVVYASKLFDYLIKTLKNVTKKCKKTFITKLQNCPAAQLWWNSFPSPTTRAKLAHTLVHDLLHAQAAISGAVVKARSGKAGVLHLEETPTLQLFEKSTGTVALDVKDLATHILFTAIIPLLLDNGYGR